MKQEKSLDRSHHMMICGKDKSLTHTKIECDIVTRDDIFSQVSLSLDTPISWSRDQGLLKENWKEEETVSSTKRIWTFCGHILLVSS